MKEKQSWWQKIHKPLDAVIITLIIVWLALLVVILLGYIFHWDWTGLNGYNSISIATDFVSTPQKITRTITYQPGKTLWDWLQLLIIPAVLAVGGYLFNYTTSKNEQHSTQLRDQTEREIAADNQRENALEAYLDNMSELLLEKHLRESAEDEEVRKIARVRTVTVLRRLDGKRKGSVLKFLREASLIDKDKCIIDLSEADLSRIELFGANLFGVDLSGANLSGANLNFANLALANLHDVDLHDANLSGANVTSEELEGQTMSLKGATMPDGSIHL